jgi:hypothetical protein
MLRGQTKQSSHFLMHLRSLAPASALHMCLGGCPARGDADGTAMGSVLVLVLALVLALVLVFTVMLLLLLLLLVVPALSPHLHIHHTHFLLNSRPSPPLAPPRPSDPLTAAN